MCDFTTCHTWHSVTSNEYRNSKILMKATKLSFDLLIAY